MQHFIRQTILKNLTVLMNIAFAKAKTNNEFLQIKISN
ncbi:hypothetical protein DDD_2605 [Nonlabens dokdonensis DSW-6]|uniref:Uncharacterized protein n=1 Tax=Nonlabens dokdonensis (strain DSM 17205 / KCTC 12402 / DSW-6) TaxID=592029 RepID=L7WBY7_NONDD|nr:hypothetical protein DDD_2605 [Nonlabens dokdonensis DSW-6]